MEKVKGVDKLQAFVIWLDGYLDAIGSDNFNINKTNVIKNKLNGLFEHVAEPVGESEEPPMHLSTDTMFNNLPSSYNEPQDPANPLMRC
jgi:hypothetical protein